MGIKKYKPVTPGLRGRVSLDYSTITTDKPYKALTVGKSSTGGRNSKGRMTMRHRGGGHKRRYRIIDFKRSIEDVRGVVQSIEYDPNRSANIALIEYDNKQKAYIIAPDKLGVGDEVLSGATAKPMVGHAMFLADIPLGSNIHAIEMMPGKGAAIARSAGTYAVLTSKEGKFAIIKLPSGEVRRILKTCKATIGTTSNPEHNQQVFGKAGRKRWLGRRPRVRGVAMNPVDHPMGGGEGRASGGHPRSRGGIMAKGQKTRNPNKHSNRHIITRRK